MAVIRIKFPDHPSVRSFADALETVPEMARGVREVRRALERPGRSVELTESEVHAAFSVRDRMSPAAAALVGPAEDHAQFMAGYDAGCRARSLAAGDRRRAEFREAKS